MASPAAVSGFGLSALLAGAGAAAWFLYFAPMVAEHDRLTTELAQSQEKTATLEKQIFELKSSQAELSTEKALTEQALQAMRRTQDELRSRLEEEVKKGSVLIDQQGGDITVDLIDKIVFDSGESELNDQGKDVLRKVGETLKKVPDKLIQISGHTDDLNISKNLIERYPTNWELSTERATNVVRFLQDEVKIPGAHLAAAGYAQYQPAGSNKTKAGRSRNRRIEVRLLPMPKHSK